MQPLLNALKPLEKGSGIDIEEKHVANILKEFSREDTSRSDMINEAFIAGSTLYTMAIQYMAAKAVFCNLEQYARALAMTTIGAKEFKDNPSVNGMKRFLLANVLPDNTEPSPSKHSSTSLLAELESSDGENSVSVNLTASPRSHDATPPWPKNAKRRVVDSVEKPHDRPARKPKKRLQENELEDEIETTVS